MNNLLYGGFFFGIMSPLLRRGGRVAEGTPLLREHRVYSSIESSNLFLSAKDV